MSRGFQRGIGVRYTVLILLLSLPLPGCFVPIPSVPEEAPYGENIEFLVVDQTTRDEVVERLGAAPISRQGGHLLIYGAARETAGRILAITIVPMTIPLEEFHFLVLEFDDDGVLRRSELAVEGSTAADVCDSQGHCIRGVEWDVEGAVPVWAKSGDIRHGERALVTASLEDEEMARQMQPQAGACAIYFFSKMREPDWVDALMAKSTGYVYYAIGDHPRYTDINSAFFSVWRVDTGSHLIRAMERNGDLIRAFPVDCADGDVVPVVAEALPTVFGADPRVRFSIVTVEQARKHMEGRRMLLE